jgi:phosphoribosyl 1,2-cyclic phosphodiesterase
MENRETELLLRVNGIQPAFGIEFGLESPRSDEGRLEAYRQANVSYSFVQLRAGQVVRHTLIDVGHGVVPSLLAFEASHDVHVVHEVLLTHPHFDHFAQLDWLSVALDRNGRADQPRPLPIYASRACWDEGPNWAFHHLASRSDFRPIRPGEPIALGELVITPFAVDHGPTVPGALGFVSQHGGRKIVMTGDFHHVTCEDDPLLAGADVCFLEANTWHPIPGLWHQSVLGDLELIDKWKPKRAYLIHYSGYEDRQFPDAPIHEPLALPRLGDELRRASGPYDVQPARHGMILGDNTLWPE